MARFLIGLALLALAGGAFASPRLLIVQHRAPLVKEVDTNVDVADYAASAFDEDGRVEPIVWAITDPEFRAAVEAGKVKSSKSPAGQEEALAGAKALNCEFLLVVEARQLGGTVLTKAELFRAGKSLWRDPDKADRGVADARIEELFKGGKISRDDYTAVRQARGYRNMAVMTAGGKLSLDGTMRSVARTWVELLRQSAFRGFEPRHVLATPAPSPGQTPKGPDPAPPVLRPAAKDSAPIIASAEDAMKAGRSTEAVLLLRDAVDASPRDLALRRELVKVLREAGLDELAEQEAMRAALVTPDAGSFRMAAARAALAAGHIDEAQAAAVEVLSKNADSPSALAVLGEIALWKGDVAAAVGRLKQAQASGDTAETEGLLALASAWSGDAEGALKAIAAAARGGIGYESLAKLIDVGADRHFGAMKALLPRATAKTGDKAAVGSEAQAFQKSADATAQLLGVLKLPAGTEKVFSRRVLAYRLLAQSLSEVVSALSTTDDDAMTDARINFGEALKEWSAAVALSKAA